MIYFDNASTTKPYEEVISEVADGMRIYFANPSSIHKMGVKCEKRLDESREIISNIINCSRNEIFFTSGGSEGNNLILKGLLKPGNHLITTRFEHHSVLKVSEELEKYGVKVTYLDLDNKGQISLEQLAKAICKDTVLVSIMHVNNEVGSIQDIKSIAATIRACSKRAKFHVDAVQSFGKIAIDIKDMDIDLLTASGHKIHGPNGIGFCYIKSGLNLNSIIKGGSQEKGLRAGTENIAGVIGMEKAARIVSENRDKNFNYVLKLKEYMIGRLKEIDGSHINSPIEEMFSPYILNVSFEGIRAEVLLHLLEEEDIYVATGSACTSKLSARSGSYVLKAMGLKNKYIEGAIRFSFSEDNKIEEVDKVIEVLKQSLTFLRRIKR